MASRRSLLSYIPLVTFGLGLLLTPHTQVVAHCVASDSEQESCRERWIGTARIEPIIGRIPVSSTEVTPDLKSSDGTEARHQYDDLTPPLLYPSAWCTGSLFSRHDRATSTAAASGAQTAQESPCAGSDHEVPILCGPRGTHLSQKDRLDAAHLRLSSGHDRHTVDSPSPRTGLVKDTGTASYEGTIIPFTTPQPPQRTSPLLNNVRSSSDLSENTGVPLIAISTPFAQCTTRHAGNSTPCSDQGSRMEGEASPLFEFSTASEQSQTSTKPKRRAGRVRRAEIAAHRQLQEEKPGQSNLLEGVEAVVSLLVEQKSLRSALEHSHYVFVVSYETSTDVPLISTVVYTQEDHVTHRQLLFAAANANVGRPWPRWPGSRDGVRCTVKVIHALLFLLVMPLVALLHVRSTHSSKRMALAAAALLFLIGHCLMLVGKNSLEAYDVRLSVVQKWMPFAFTIYFLSLSCTVGHWYTPLLHRLHRATLHLRDPRMWYAPPLLRRIWSRLRFGTSDRSVESTTYPQGYGTDLQTDESRRLIGRGRGIREVQRSPSEVYYLADREPAEPASSASSSDPDEAAVLPSSADASRPVVLVVEPKAK